MSLESWWDLQGGGGGRGLGNTCEAIGTPTINRFSRLDGYLGCTSTPSSVCKAVCLLLPPLVPLPYLISLCDLPFEVLRKLTLLQLLREGLRVLITRQVGREALAPNHSVLMRVLLSNPPAVGRGARYLPWATAEV